MKEIESVCIVGAGAIGSLFAGHLGSLVQAKVLARREEHAARLNAEGLQVSGKSDLHAGIQASTNPAELGDVDLVIIATKATAVEPSARTLAGHFPNATIMTVQNGLGCEQVVANHGDWPIISSVTFMSGVRHSDVHVEYELDTATWMGPWSEGTASYDVVEQVADLINRSGLKAEPFRDLRPAQWSKLLFNSSVNSIGAVTDLPHVKAFAKQDDISDLGNLVRAMMDEGKQVAAAQGIDLYEDPWEMNVKAVSHGSTGEDEYAHVFSMLDDVRNQRHTEVDWLTGAVVREAARLGVPAPIHETLYRLVKAKELSWTQGS
ncbi:MAG: 2-dehydropantoate 2-reductase [Gammaproteobacteria bacterium]|nr:2-dehydropantoate 2-reductase [Gammaproteobacteria bacterium]